MKKLQNYWFAKKDFKVEGTLLQPSQVYNREQPYSLSFKKGEKVNFSPSFGGYGGFISQNVGVEGKAKAEISDKRDLLFYGNSFDFEDYKTTKKVESSKDKSSKKVESSKDKTTKIQIGLGVLATIIIGGSLFYFKDK